ncbi:uncharacterized protein LOC135841742 [Planococcus citri]|uniref:uncharacterized protein LOC135841742 n=1 Tax=Planococcus citri TaxID=170843 RepID=UPI0031F8883D
MNGSEWCVRFPLQKNFNFVFGLESNLEIQDVKIELDNMKSIEGYQSDIQIGRSKYKYRNGNQKYSRSVVIKNYPASFPKPAFTEITFSNEIFVFNKVIPFFKTMDDSISNLFPEFYCGCLDFSEKEEGCIIMENLQENHYRLTNSKVFLDIEHLMLSMKKIGEFHAYSYQAKQQRSKEFYSLVDGLVDTHYVITNVIIGFLPPIIEYFLDVLSAESKYYNEKVHEIRLLVGDVEKFIATIFTTRTEPTAVLCHGDFLRNNLMFKYDEEDVPVHVKFIDLGNMRYCSPVTDLGLILYMNADQTTREEYWDALIDAYYDSMKNTFPKNDSIPSKDEILLEFKHNVLAPCLLLSSFLPYMMAIEEHNRSLSTVDEFSQEYEDYKDTSFFSSSTDVIVNNTIKLFRPHRTERVLQILRDVINRGFI